MKRFAFIVVFVAAGALGLSEKELRGQDSHTCEYPKSHEPAVEPIKLRPYSNRELQDSFNQASHEVRVLALLSPTCPACQHGQRVVQDVFEKFPRDQRLRGFVVWLPMLRTDDQRAAGQYAATFQDARVSQVWDGERASGQLLAKTLGLNRTAWDVYLLFAPGVKWTSDVPPAPTFWMHQLREDSGADQRVCLNPAIFSSKVADLIRAALQPAP